MDSNSLLSKIKADPKVVLESLRVAVIDIWPEYGPSIVLIAIGYLVMTIGKDPDQNLVGAVLVMIGIYMLRHNRKVLISKNCAARGAEELALYLPQGWSIRVRNPVIVVTTHIAEYNIFDVSSGSKAPDYTDIAWDRYIGPTILFGMFHPKKKRSWFPHLSVADHLKIAVMGKETKQVFRGSARELIEKMIEGGC